MGKIRREELAKRLTEFGFPITTQTLASHASRRTGPEYGIFGKVALYDLAVAIAWAQARMSTPQCGKHAA